MKGFASIFVTTTMLCLAALALARVGGTSPYPPPAHAIAAQHDATMTQLARVCSFRMERLLRIRAEDRLSHDLRKRDRRWIQEAADCMAALKKGRR